MADEKNKIIDITDQDIYLVSQQIQKRYVKFVVLNNVWEPIGEIKGQVVSGNINIDATNNIRRTASIEMIVGYESIEMAAHFIMHNYLQLWCGIENNYNSTVSWYNQGIFAINNSNYKFDSKSRILSASLVDLMAELNGDKGGVLHSYTALVKGEQRIDTVIANVLRICGFTSMDILPIGAISDNEDYDDYLVPYDINFNVGVTAYEIIEKLVTLYPYYRMRFDVNGTFICDETVLENDETEPLISAGALDKVIISEDRSVDWTKIKNHIEVWGKDGLYYGEASDNNPLSPFQVNEIGILRAVYAGDIYDNIYDRYKHPEKVAGYQEDQAKYEASIADLKSKKPSSESEKAEINKKLSEARTKLAQTKQRIKSDIYIYGNDMANDYAKKLLYENCRINDSITLQTVFLPFINEVDFKIQHRTQLDFSVNNYVLKSVSHDLKAGTSTLNLVRFYDEQKSSELVQLSAPHIISYSVNGMTITITFNPVSKATNYNLYADFNVVETSTEGVFVYTMDDSKEGTHSFYVTALATSYRESDFENVITVNMTAGTRLIDENDDEIITENNECIIV